MTMSIITCRTKVLTRAQAALAAKKTLEINPANAIGQRTVMRSTIGRPGGPLRLTLNLGHRWASTGVRLTVQFLDSPPADLRKRILSHMNAWNKTANVHFTETRKTGDVRITRLDRPEAVSGYWSYLGNEILGIPDDEPTLNLEGFTMSVPEAEFKRVVRHEAGHTLGFEHEHMRAELVKKIDRAKAFAFFDRTQGWTKADVEAQVLTPLKKASVMGTTEADPLSIMCYQIPAAITKNGKVIPGGLNINSKDFAFAGSVYPLKVRSRR